MVIAIKPDLEQATREIRGHQRELQREMRELERELRDQGIQMQKNKNRGIRPPQADI